MSEEFGLKRVLGLKELVAIEVGTTIGAGVFVLSGMALDMGGPLLPFAFLLAALPIILVMLTLAMMGSVVPTVGGTYRYPSRLFSPMWAFIGVWGYALGMVFGAFPLYALRCSEYMLKAFSYFNDIDPNTLDAWVCVIAVLMLTVFFLANLRGIMIAATVQGLMVLVLVSALLYFGIDGLREVKLENMKPLLPHGVSGFLAASALLTFALLGSNSVIELGGEIKNPGRNIPVSLFISIPLVTAVYFIVGLVSAGARPWQESAGKLLTYPAEAFMGSIGLKFFIICGAVLAITTTLNATFMWATKSMMIVAHDGLIPPRLASTNRFGAPHLFLFIIWALAVLAVIFRAPAGTFEIYASIGGLIIFIPVMISALLVRKKLASRYSTAPFKLKGFMYWLCPSAGVLLALLIMGMLLSQLKPLPLIFFFGWLALGAVFYLARKRSLQRFGQRNMKEWMEKELEKLAGTDQPIKEIIRK